MCGRYSLAFEKNADKMNSLIDLCNQSAVPENQIHVKASGEISPGNNAPGLIYDQHKVRAISMRWGFSGAEGGFVINARSETVYERSMFRSLIERNRCALPASAYFEWRRGDGQKYHIASETDETLYLAGLYRKDEYGTAHFVVLTRASFGKHAEIHSRMPVTLHSREEARQWLRGEIDINALTKGNDTNLHPVALGPEQLSMTFDDQPDDDM